MRPLDLFLFAIAVGLSLFTVHVFSSGISPAAAIEESRPEPAPARNPDFRSIVLHHSATHGGSAAAFDRNHRARLGGLAYHFIVGNGQGSADGEVETGYRWRDQIPGPHTKNQQANLESIAVCVVGDLQAKAPSEKQFAALLDLLERLCRECRIPPARVLSHREVDPETQCPGRGLPMDGLRAALAARLASAPR
jgi:N-acetyl-anhydromuramyl-L-alanine amidase AmpD